MTQLQFALLALLVLAGLVIRRRTLGRDWPLWLGAVYVTALHLVFHMEGRYSMPARPMLLVYAGASGALLITWLTRRTRERRAAMH